MNRTLTLTLLLLAACGGEGPWTLETYGEDFIEQGIPAEAFEDGCSASFDRFLVLIADRALLEDDGTAAASIDGAQVYDLVPAGPHEMATLTAPSGTWRGVRAAIRPDSAATAGNASEADVADLLAASASILITGSLTCGEDTVTFEWPLDTRTTYTCDPENLVIGAGTDALTQLTVHGDHLFYDSLVDPEAVLRAQAYVDADDGDGELTVAELAAAPVAPTGLDVGSLSEVDDLWAYLQAQSRTLGHVDGEGHCDVE
jgi:hypothetical protein